MKTVHDASSTQPVRGEKILRKLERPFLTLDTWIERGVTAKYNPLAQTGAIANMTFLVAVISGILLLIWYRPSVHHAYNSVESMAAYPWTGHWIRSLHRYSSDACLFFVLLHATRLFFARRFVGARWWAWVTGIVSVGLLWLVGWLGYWLVWDARGQQVATGTAKMLDLVPIFSDPLSRTFLTDADVSSLFFFVVFFVHMLTPLLIAFALWLHIARVSRAKFLTTGPMTLWTVGTLLIISRIFPITSAPAAEMATQQSGFTIDAWYLIPLMLTDRLSGGALWAVLILGGALLITLPWTLRRGQTVTAVVNTSICNSCTLCARDCPYDAITMVPRDDGRKYEFMARVDPAKCVGCGICVGSCDPGSIALDWLPNRPTRLDIDAWVDATIAENQPPLLAFLCSGSAAADFQIDPQTGLCTKLPGYRVLAVPCSGWVQRLTLERALRRGTKAILIVGCSNSEPPFREGLKWTQNRLEGDRRPELRRDKIEHERIVFVQYNRTQPHSLIQHAQELQQAVETNTPGPIKSANTSKHIFTTVPVALTAATSIAAITLLISHTPYPAPAPEPPKLVVSFKHHGEISDTCHDVSPEDQAKVPAHMRRATICERARADVRIRVFVNDNLSLERTYIARGVQRDGPALALEHITIPQGQHTIRIQLSDTHDPNTWPHTSTHTTEFTHGHRQILTFDHLKGFTWHP